MTTLYLDTEFNGHGGELISMALVSPDGHEFYAAKGPDDPLAMVNEWVAANVIPKLDTPLLREGKFEEEFRSFIIKFRNPEIICDWYADAVHFCSMLRGPSFELSLDFPCRITILKTPPGVPVSDNPHNALADARALMQWHHSLTVR